MLCSRCGIEVMKDAGILCKHCDGYLRQSARSIVDAEWWKFVDEEETDRLFFGKDNPVKCRFLALMASRPKKVIVKANGSIRTDSPGAFEATKHTMLTPKRTYQRLADYEYAYLIDVPKTQIELGIKEPLRLTIGANRKVFFRCNDCGESAIRPLFLFTKGAICCQVCTTKKRADAVAAKKREKRTFSIDVENAALLEYRQDGKCQFKCLDCEMEFEARKGNVANSFEKFGTNCCPNCQSVRTGTSVIEAELISFIDSVVKEKTTPLRVGNYRADAYVESKRFILEMDGLYWHSEAIKKNPLEMQNRKSLLDSMGYRVFNIFEHEWKSKRSVVENRIRASLGLITGKYRAEEMHIGRIDVQIARFFLEENHLMGAGELRSDMCYGMFDKNAKLVSVCTFAQARSGNKRDYQSTVLELNRYAATAKIYGALTRYIHLCLKEFPSTTQVYSYADYRFSSSRDNFYLSSGFTFDSLTEPGYFWFKGQKVLSRHKTQKHLLSDLLGESFAPTMSESDNMHMHGWLRVYDAGHLKYVLNV